MDPTTGLVLGERYELVDRVASGGMGDVWRGTDTILLRTIAVKILKAELLESAEFIGRFRAEARHAAALMHPGIAGVFDYGEDASGAYLVMEFVDGESLSTLLARTPVPPLADTLSILAQTADALDAAHTGGVIHRDVKPGNIMVMPRGTRPNLTVKVTDFGIARAVDSVPVTAVGQVIGTPQYMSPEQAAGSDVGTATDIYSLGVIAYEMLAGYRPFVAETPLALAMAHVHDAPPPLPARVPAAVVALVMRALAKAAHDRPRSAAALAAELRALAEESEISAVAAADDTPTRFGEPTGMLSATQVSDPSGRSRTEIMPAGGVAVGAPLLVVRATDSVTPPRRGRRAVRMIAALLAASALVVVIGAVRNRDSSSSLGTDAALSSADTPAELAAALAGSTTAATTPATPTTIALVVDPQAYVGRPAADVVAELQALGFVVDTRAVRQGADGAPDGTVVGIEPSGPLSPNSAVTVLVSEVESGKPEKPGKPEK